MILFDYFFFFLFFFFFSFYHKNFVGINIALSCRSNRVALKQSSYLYSFINPAIAVNASSHSFELFALSGKIYILYSRTSLTTSLSSNTCSLNCKARPRDPTSTRRSSSSTGGWNTLCIELREISQTGLRL